MIIAVFVCSLAGATYWLGIRPLPETSGRVLAPISVQAKISRDARGVPHIQAASIEDALFLEGYAMAQDRLWQMDALRRRAAGELSEIVGKAALTLDMESRRLGLAHIAEMQEANLSAEDRAVMQAFAGGVNFFIETHRGKLPLEFTLLRYAPKPWRARDSMLAGMEMYRTLTTSWPRELAKEKMLEHGDRAKVALLFPARTGMDRQPGSNAWVISGAHTASGKPILANDPHLEFALPSPWYLAHLAAPGLDVTGATIVGLPGIVTGHNRDIAWGVTNLEFDVQDLYREQMDRQTGQYMFLGKPARARKIEEWIAVKGAPAVKLETWITEHGPVLLDENGRYLSLRWSAAEKGAFTYPFVELDRARNWEEFRSALRRFGGPGQNFVYADTRGNIGYQATGRLPLRKTCRGDVPADGDRGDCEWDGMVPFEDLPSLYNPPSGRIATANQNPFPPNTDFQVAGNFAPPYRARQIQARLAAKENWKPQEMLSVETDVYSGFAEALARQLTKVLEKRTARTKTRELLQQWNGQMDARGAAPMLIMLTYAELRKRIADRAAPGFGEQYQASLSTAAIAQLLEQRPKDWFADFDELLIQCLNAAMDEGSKTQGRDFEKWQWGAYQPLSIVNPVVGRLPLLGRFVDIGPVEMRGAPTTVFQYTGRLGPSLRIITDLADLDHSFANLATGESGQILSPHYKDQWDAYYHARSFPMEFEKLKASDVLIVDPRR